MSILGILGEKEGMTQVFDDDGTALPVTAIEAGPCPVVQVKTEESDGYTAVQVGFGEASGDKKDKLPWKGHFERAGVEPCKHLREFPVLDPDEYEPGDDVTVEIFEDVDLVDVSGVTKGHGFSGMVKRHGANTGPKAHGSRSVREPGAIGHAADPSRVFPGKEMPGQHGNEQRTMQNLEVVRVDADRNLLLVKGSVPGPKGGLLDVMISKKEQR